MSLTGRIALVSGSGRGIGRSIALKLAREGARLVLNDIDEAPAAETAREIREHGGQAIPYVGDVTSPDFGESFVNSALSAYGGIDIIVNNAGYTWDSVIQKTSDQQFQAMLDVHLIAPFRILRAAAEPIRLAAKKEAASGREVFRKVVNVSSIAGTAGNPGQTNYSSAKAALHGMTKTLAKEWGRYRVNVNCVAFGIIDTRLSAAVTGEKTSVRIGEREIAIGVPEQSRAGVVGAIPLGRSGRPEEAAGAVYLFCTPESDYITGQVVVCGGGLE